MWRVTASRNLAAMEAVENVVIYPLFALLAAAQRLGTCDPAVVFTAAALPAPSDAVLRWLLGRTMDTTHVGSVVLPFAASSSKHQLARVVRLYRSQTLRCRDSQHGRLKSVNVAPELAWFFRVVLYRHCFSDARFWSTIRGVAFDRVGFRDNFFLDNRMTVCPYCDVDTISSHGVIDLDHFLPSSKFPLLSMEPYNIVPICGSCNMPQYGKGSDVRAGVASPFGTQVGDHVTFSVDNIAQAIEIAEIAGAGPSNFCELMKLRARYRDQRVWYRWHSRIQALVSSFSRVDGVDVGMIRGYIEATGRSDGLYFLLRQASVLDTYLLAVSRTASTQVVR